MPPTPMQLTPIVHKIVTQPESTKQDRIILVDYFLNHSGSS